MCTWVWNSSDPFVALDVAIAGDEALSQRQTGLREFQSRQDSALPELQLESQSPLDSEVT